MEKTKTERNKVTIDNILPNLGEYGLFQKLLNVVFFLTCLPASYQVLIMYFSTITPPWRCRSNSSLCLYNGTRSPDDISRCHMNRSEWFYTERKTYSLVTQFGIDCEKEWQLHLVSSVHFIGWGIGSIIWGWAGDQFGRKSVLYPSLASILIIGFATAFSTNIYVVVAFRFCIGIFIPAVQLQSFVLISELVGSKHRPLAGILVYLSNPLGWCILTLKAYFIRDWKILSIASTAPYCLVFLFYKYVPESIKWLHLHGKTDDVSDVVHRIAKRNNREIPENLQIEPPTFVAHKKANPMDIFRTRKLTSLSLLQAILWTVSATCYYGVHLAANDLGGNVYRDFVLLNTVELPGIALAVVFCNVLGRKRASIAPLFLGGLTCIAIAFTPTTVAARTGRVALGIFGDLCLTITFNAIYPWSVEIYPLDIRNEGMGFLQLVAHAGSALAPWMVKGLKRYGQWCPFIALAVPAIIASVMSLWLPETKTNPDKSDNNGDDFNNGDNNILEKSVIANKAAIGGNEDF